MSFSGDSTLEIPQRMKECLLFIIFYARHSLCSCVSDHVYWTVSSRLSLLASAVFPYRALLELVPQNLPVLNCYLVLSSCFQHSSLILVELRLAVTTSEDFLYRDPHQSLKPWVRCTIMWAGVWEENKIADVALGSWTTGANAAAAHVLFEIGVPGITPSCLWTSCVWCPCRQIHATAHRQPGGFFHMVQGD